jgi:hypothetical protein
MIQMWNNIELIIKTLQQSKGDYWIRELWNAKPYGYNDKINSICNGEYTTPTVDYY